MNESVAIDWLQLNMGLFGGLALFLAGLEGLSEGLRRAAGGALRSALARLTRNRFAGAVTGAVVTGILNSSSVTTVLVVGFVTAGAMTLTQSVGVIMGANIGSTVTAQILAFNVSAYSLMPVAVGFFMYFAGRNETTRNSGMVVMGMGLVFYGMGLMSSSMNPLRAYPPFMDILGSMSNPALGIIAGAVFTAVVQSSAATVGIAIAMASEGLLDLNAGIALALGANVGTCATALLAAIGKPAEAVRAAVVHISFNVLGVLIWLPFIPVLAEIASLLTDTNGPSSLPREIANANTMFNVINTLLFIGFASWFARFSEKLVPDRRADNRVIIRPMYLDPALVNVTSVALGNTRRELARAGDILVDMLKRVQNALDNHDAKLLDSVARSESKVEVLHREILAYLGQIRQNGLTEDESDQLEALMIAVGNFDSLAETLQTDLARTVGSMIHGDFQRPSETTSGMLGELWSKNHQALKLAVQAVREHNERAAQEALLLHGEVRRLADELFERHATRLRADDPQYLEKVRLLMSLIENLRHVYTLSKRIARAEKSSRVSQSDVEAG